MALKLLGRTRDAATSLAQAIAFAPAEAASHLNLANLLHDLGDLAGAERHCRTAIALAPSMAEAHTVLGFLLTQTCDIPGAIAACEEAIRINPALSEAHCNLGIALLTAGDLPGGFARYEWRKRHPVYGKEFFSLSDPEWRGEQLDGKRVVIMAEQGLGDAIMFARYAAVLAKRGAASVMIACDRRLVPLLQHAPGVAQAIPKSRTMPPFDFWVDQMSLPLLCGTTLEPFPLPVPISSPTRSAWPPGPSAFASRQEQSESASSGLAIRCIPTTRTARARSPSSVTSSTFPASRLRACRSAPAPARPRRSGYSTGRRC